MNTAQIKVIIKPQPIHLPKTLLQHSRRSYYIKIGAHQPKNTPRLIFCVTLSKVSKKRMGKEIETDARLTITIPRTSDLMLQGYVYGRKANVKSLLTHE
jgi:hypothetical protein